MKKLTQKLQRLKINLKFRLYQFKLEFIVYGISLLYAILIGQSLNAIVLFISFNMIRPATPITFHFDEVNVCIKVSIIMFIVSISQIAVIPTNVTYCGGIIVGLLISYALYKIEFYILRKKSKLNLDCCTAEQITYCCKLLKYKKDKIDLAIKFFVEKYTNLQVYNWLCENKLNVEYETVAKYKYRILKDLREFEKKS